MLGNVVGAAVGSVVPIVRLPHTLLQGVESLLEQLTNVAARAQRVIDQVEGLPARVEAVVTRAEAVPDRIDAVLVRADALTKKVDGLTRTVGGVVADAATTLTSVQPAVAAVAALDPAVIARIVEDAAALLPRLAALEELVPVVAQLGVQVDHLDATVADVGALLGGIPGAARLLKRGTPTAR